MVASLFPWGVLVLLVVVGAESFRDELEFVGGVLIITSVFAVPVVCIAISVVSLITLASSDGVVILAKVMRVLSFPSVALGLAVSLASMWHHFSMFDELGFMRYTELGVLIGVSVAYVMITVAVERVCVARFYPAACEVVELPSVRCVRCGYPRLESVGVCPECGRVLV